MVKPTIIAPRPSRMTAAVLGVLPGAGHLYLGHRRRGLILLLTTVLGAFAFWFGATLIAPGNMRLGLVGPLFYTLVMLPVCIVYSIIDAWQLAGDDAAPDAQTAGRGVAAWGWAQMLIGAAGLLWSLSAGGRGILHALSRCLPLLPAAGGLWLVGAGLRGRLATRAWVVEHMAVITVCVAGAVTWLAASAELRPVLDYWGLVPAALGIDALVTQRRWRDDGRRRELRIGNIAQLIGIATVVAGLVLTPLGSALEFPFSSALRLPHIFNLGKPAALAVCGPSSSVGYRFAENVVPGLRYTYGGTGNVKVIGDPQATGIRTQVMTAARAETADAARAAAEAAMGMVYASDGTNCIVTDAVVREPSDDVSRDVLFIVPATGDVAIDIGFGLVQIVGVQGDVSVRTGFGQVDVVDCGGRIDVTTGWGNVRIDGSHAAVTATTDFGTVTCRADSVAGETQLVTKVGQIRYSLPADAAADVSARTNQGAIRAGFDGGSRTNKGGMRTLAAQLGDGGAGIRLETGFGDISVSTWR